MMTHRTGHTRHNRRAGFRADLNAALDAALRTWGWIAAGTTLGLFLTTTYRLGEWAALVTTGAIR